MWRGQKHTKCQQQLVPQKDLDSCSTGSAAAIETAPYPQPSVLAVSFTATCKGIQIFIGKEVWGPQVPQCRPLLRELQSTMPAMGSCDCDRARGANSSVTQRDPRSEQAAAVATLTEFGMVSMLALTRRSRRCLEGLSTCVKDQPSRHAWHIAVQDGRCSDPCRVLCWVIQGQGQVDADFRALTS